MGNVPYGIQLAVSRRPARCLACHNAFGDAVEDFFSRRSWRAIHPHDAASLLAAISAPWWIAGGWALDLFRGAPARPHVDLDVGVLRCDVLSLLEALPTWQVFEAQDGQLTGLGGGCVPRQ